MFAKTPRGAGPKAALFLLLAPLALSAARADSLRVTVANAADNAIYDVTVSGSGGSTTLLNSDSGTSVHASYRSLAWVNNAATGRRDLVAADTVAGALVRYAGGTGAGVVIWSRSAAGSGPSHPDGLSVDASGNMFLVSYHCAGDDNQVVSEVWMLPRDPAQPVGAGFLAPRLVDATFYSGSAAAIEVESIKDTLVVPQAIPAAGLNAGDLLVLVSDDDDAASHGDTDDGRVLVYTAASLAAVANASGPVLPAASLLLPSQFAAGEFPSGFDLWPADNSLLVATSAGDVRRFALGAGGSTALANFASGLGSGLGKLKAGLNAGVPTAWVLQSAAGSGQALKFGAPPASGANLPLATVNAGLTTPAGLVLLANVGVADAATCASAAGCDILGGLIPHKVVTGAQPVTGKVYEESCTVAIDPRLAQFGTCTGHTLPVSQMCPGFGDTVIPDTLCGASGPSGKGFALVKTVADGVDVVPGLLVYTEAFAEKVLGGTPTAPCPQITLGWAPRSSSVEGTIVEGNSMLEFTSGCGSSRGVSHGLSIFGVGFALNADAFPAGTTPTLRLAGFANQKLANLASSASSTNANIAPLTRARLQACVARAQWHLAAGRYQCAARKAWRCDQIVANNAADFGTSSTNPNPYGQSRSRLANIFLTIDARILGHAPATTWPVAAPARCMTNPEDD